MEWQNPVKDTYKAAVAGQERIVKLLEVTKVPVDAKTQILMLLDKSKDITQQIEKDGSWGVHAPEYLKLRAETAMAYLNQAQAILDKGDFPLVEAKKEAK